MTISWAHTMITLGLLTLFGCAEGDFTDELEQDAGALVPLDGYLGDAGSDPHDSRHSGPYRDQSALVGVQPPAVIPAQPEPEQKQDSVSMEPRSVETRQSAATPGPESANPADGGCAVHGPHTNVGWFGLLLLGLQLRRWQRGPTRAHAARGR